MTLPVVHPLPSDFSIAEAFGKLAERPGCLWLDSASSGSFADILANDSPIRTTGRHSFLTSDPIEQILASPRDPDPWPTLQAWCRRLPREHHAALPPFQGGIAGLIGYESATWLDSVGLAPDDDLPVPAMSVGWYDWTIAVDHETNQAWIISQGAFDDPSHRIESAAQRIQQVLDWLNAPASDFSPPPATRTITSVQYPTDRDDVRSNFTRDGFCDAVGDIVDRIRSGDSFQVNLAQRLLRVADRPSPQLYLQLRAANPAPMGAYYNGGDFQVCSSSPEGFLRVVDRHVQTRPIKGTVRRTGHDDVDLKLAQKLAASEKDWAENVMIVDLMRNDLSRVCADDSVNVIQLCKVERYQFVQHLVSIVEGTLKPDATIADLLMTCFPGGSVTGAPKIEAMRTIAALERHPRGPYCGSIGYIGCGGTADFNILIRTITAAHGHWQIPVGGGITSRSIPATEEYETWSKAEGMLRAIASRT